MKLFFALLAAIVAVWVLWAAFVVLILFAPDRSPEDNLVSVPSEPSEIIPEHVQYFRSEERAKRLGKLTTDYEALRADNNKRIAQACAAGHLDKEYCE